MEKGNLILALGLLGVGAFAFYKLSQPGGTSFIDGVGSVPPPLPTSFPTGGDLGVFKPVLGLPGLGQSYQALKPVNDRIIQPIVKQLNSAVAAVGLPTKQVTVTQNPDGTITRHFSGVRPEQVLATVGGAGKAAVHTLTFGLL